MKDEKPISDARSLWLDPKLAQFLKEQFSAMRRELKASRDECMRLSDEAIERFRQTNPEMRERREFVEGMRALNERIAAQGRRMDAHLGDHEMQRRAASRMNRHGRTRDRDEQGRLVDQLLIDVGGRMRKLGLTQRQLAEELGVDYRRLNRWITLARSPQKESTRERLKAWLMETESEALAISNRALSELEGRE